MLMPKEVGELKFLSYWFIGGMLFENTPKPSSVLPDRTFGRLAMQPLKRIMMHQAARIFRMYVIWDFMVPPSD